MKNLQFNPNYVIVPLNTQVVWINIDVTNGIEHRSVDHAVVNTQGLFASPRLPTNHSFTFQFTRPGTYDYYCPYYENMRGTIVVVDQPF